MREVVATTTYASPCGTRYAETVSVEPGDEGWPAVFLVVEGMFGEAAVYLDAAAAVRIAEALLKAVRKAGG